MIVQPDFLDHYKTQMLVDMTGDPASPLFVLRLWGHCQQRRSATFARLAPSALKAICRAVALEANKLRSILLQCGFIRVEGDLTIVHGWEETNAALFGAWENGKKGGRPPKQKPTENPRVTDGLPAANPNETDKRREEKTRPEPLKPPPQAADVVGGVEELSMQEVWQWACRLTGHPGVHKSRNEQQVLADARGITREGCALIERYHARCREEPGKYPKPRATPATLIEEFQAEVGKARQALGATIKGVFINAKTAPEFPADWSKFAAGYVAQIPGREAEFTGCKTWAEVRSRFGNAFDAIRDDYANWKKQNA